MTRSSDDDAVAFAPGFAVILRERTALVHRQAERSGFIADLIRGRATREGYMLFLRNLVPVYVALETALAGRHGSPILAAFADPRLARLRKLEHDIATLGGANRDCPGLPEASAYAEAIKDAGAGNGIRLVAHGYARYLGDLSGGQILKPLLARSFSLDADALTFYDFPDFADLAEPKAAMRVALDRLPAEGPIAEAVAGEAIAAFHHNIAVSEAVQRALA